MTLWEFSCEVVLPLSTLLTAVVLLWENEQARKRWLREQSKREPR